MTDLVAWISSDSAENKHVERVIEGESWEKVYVFAGLENKGKIPNKPNVFPIVIDNSKPMPELVKEIKSALDGKINAFETAVNFIAGSGKQHSVLLSALLQLGCGFRIVVYTKEGVREL